MTLEKLIIATGNRGKYNEFVSIIKNFTYEITGINETGKSREIFSEIVGVDETGKSREFFADEIIFAPEIGDMIIDETGKTYAENAMLKARAWSEKSGLPCLADDSGLEVEAFDGAPGLYSARIIPGNDEDKVSWLLSQLEGKINRKARFVAALALCVPGKFTLICEGECKGEIANSSSGKNGFGYDPVFIPDGFSHTFAELSSDIKNKISHRADAFGKILEFIK